MKYNIHTFFGEKVVQIDTTAQKVRSENQSTPYDKLVIASGSRPVIPNIMGLNKNGTFTLKSMQDVDAILDYPGKTVAVAGSGPIGTSASAALKQRGFNVYLIASSPHILPTAFDERPSSLIKDILEDNGVTVLPGENVTEISGNGKVTGIITDKRSIECDMVILVKGMQPNVDLATDTGLKLGNLGAIKVNNQMRTSKPNIYACGDCVETKSIITGKPTLSLKWRSAREQATVVAHNCIGQPTNYPGSVDVAGITIFDTHAVSMGLNSNAISNNTVEIIERKYPSRYYRLLTSNKVVVGAQFINHTRYAGAVLNAMRRGSDGETVKNIVEKKRLPIVTSSVPPANSGALDRQ